MFRKLNIFRRIRSLEQDVDNLRNQVRKLENSLEIEENSPHFSMYAKQIHTTEVVKLLLKESGLKLRYHAPTTTSFTLDK